MFAGEKSYPWCIIDRATTVEEIFKICCNKSSFLVTTDSESQNLGEKKGNPAKNFVLLRTETEKKKFRTVRNSQKKVRKHSILVTSHNWMPGSGDQQILSSAQGATYRTT